MNLVTRAVCALLGLSLAASAAHAEYREVPVNVSLFPPFAIAGSGDSVVTKFGYNLIVGKTAGLHGAETGLISIKTDFARGSQASAFVNVTHGPVSGLQAAGIVNTAESLLGLQAAGLVNHVSGDFSGGQAAGLVNRVSGDLSGGQAAFLVNSVGGTFHGLQAGGIVNSVSGGIEGAQAAGLFNHARTVTGAQAAGFMNHASDSAWVQAAGFLNIANRSMTQLGMVNVADVSTGVQIGLINWSEDQQGVPIGAFSRVKGVPVRLSTWGDESGFANVGIVSGTPTYYSLLTAGYNVQADSLRWSVGYGWGGHVVRGKTFYDLDATTSFLINEENPEPDETLTRIRCAIGRQFASRFAAYAGVSLNVYTSRHTNGEDFIPYTVLDGTIDDTYTAFWPGFYVGFRF